LQSRPEAMNVNILI